MDDKIKNKRITLAGLDKTASRVNNTYVKVNELQGIFDNIKVSTENDAIKITFPDVKKDGEVILQDKSITIDLSSYRGIIVLNSGSYNVTTLEPTIAPEQINPNAIYLVPVMKTGEIERYVAWFYRNDWIEVSDQTISSNEINNIIGED